MTTARTDHRRRRSLRAGALGAGALALVLSLGSSARAQTKEELDKARILFQEGVALSAANNCAAALTKYRDVAKVKQTAQVAFNIAECEQRLGKLTSALGNYRLAASQAEGDPKAKKVTDVVGARIDDLEARVPKLLIKRGKGAQTASIELDGSEIGGAQLSAEIPVDPGPHLVSAKVGGKEYLHESVTLAEKETKTFEVKLDLPTVRLEKKPDELPPEEPKEEPPPPAKSKAPGVALLAVGGVGLALGAVFLVLRQGTINDLTLLCGGGLSCPASAKPTGDMGRLDTGVAEVGFGVGAAGLITGIVLLATSGAPKPKQAGAALLLPVESRGLRFVGAAPGASVGGASLVGRF